MSLKQIAILAIGASAFAISALSQPADAMTVTSFETPVVNGGYEYSSNSPFLGPNGNFGPTTADGVTFYGMSGIQANGSAWGFTTAPDGNQTAFLQSYSGEPDAPGYITFTSDSLTAGLTYDLVFDVESRPQQDGGLPYTVTATVPDDLRDAVDHCVDAGNFGLRCHSGIEQFRDSYQPARKPG